MDDRLKRVGQFAESKLSFVRVTLITSQVYTQNVEMSRRISQNAEKTITRLKAHYGVSTDTALAKALGVSVSTVNGWYDRGVSCKTVIEKCENVSLDWLFRDQVLGHPGSQVNQVANGNGNHQVVQIEREELEGLRAERDRLQEQVVSLQAKVITLMEQLHSK